MWQTSKSHISYFDLSHAASNLSQCWWMMFILITAAAAVWTAWGWAPGGPAVHRTWLRGPSLIGASFNWASLLGSARCWTRLILWRSCKEKNRSRAVLVYPFNISFFFHLPNLGILWGRRQGRHRTGHQSLTGLTGDLCFGLWLFNSYVITANFAKLVHPYVWWPRRWRTLKQLNK